MPDPVINRYPTTTDADYGDFSHLKRKHKLPPGNKKNATKTPAPGAASTLRIIGGQWRGRKLSFPVIEGLRPTGDRVRETLFNWLAAKIPDSRCLDLFTGAGALGLEALSRGAAEVVMIDKHPVVARQLRSHLKTLNCERGRVVEADALTWLADAIPLQNKPFDVIFIDPPFQMQLWQGTMAALENSGLMAAETAIYLETPRQAPLQVPAYWYLHREKQAGQISFRLYYRKTGAGTTD